MDRVTRAAVALGSNLGDCQAQLDRALELLRQHPALAVDRISTYHETNPVGGPEGQGWGFGSAVQQVNLNTSWQRVSVSYTIKSPGSTLDFQAYLPNPGSGTAFYADDAAIVLG